MRTAASTAGVLWWQEEWALVATWEAHAASTDPSIQRLPGRVVRDHRGLREHIRLVSPDSLPVWGYLGTAEGRWPLRRLVALFPAHPAQCAPIMLSLDGPTDSLHRNSDLELCLYYTRDPEERRWRPSDGLPRLFDLGRVHLAAEDAWRRRGRREEDWPLEQASHGYGRPARTNPALALPPELPQLDCGAVLR